MLYFIANAHSGKRKKQRIIRKIEGFCKKYDVLHEFHFTERAKHCTEIVRNITSNAEGIVKILIIGGDGTFHEALNGIADLSKTILGFIPSGSGNDFAAFYKPARQSIKKILSDVLSEKTRKIDFIEFKDGVRCLNVAGTGLDIEVLLKARAFRRLTGKPNYIKCLVRILKNFDPYDLTITSNGKTQTYSCIMAGLCNGKQMGGGIKISPFSKLDDGKLNLVIMKDVERRKIKWLLPRFLSGRHMNMPCTVHELIADSVQISDKNDYKVQLDGEIYSNLNFDARVVPSGLTVFG